MSNSRVTAWVIWFIASIFYAYQYILRVMPSIMLPDIMRQFHIDAGLFGQFSGVYYIGYSLMHLPLGIMLDRFGPRKVMTGCILLTVVGMLPIIFCEYWVYPVIGRVLIGMGSSAAILGTFKIIRMSFKTAQFPRMLSISVTIGLIGAIYGGGPVSYLSSHLGYQTVVQIFIAMGLVLALATYLIVPEMESTQRGAILNNVKEVLGNTRVILCCIFAGLMVGPLEGFADVWGSTFLHEVYGFDKSTASSLPSMIFLGMCFGGPLLSLIAERWGNYLGVVICAGLLMMTSFVALLSVTLPSYVIATSFVLVGICCAYQILSIFKASTYVAEHVAGLTTALANMIIMSFGYGFHTIIGVVVDTYGGANNSHAMIYGIMIIPLTLSIGIAGYIKLMMMEKGND